MLSRDYRGEYDFALLYEQLLNIHSFTSSPSKIKDTPRPELKHKAPRTSKRRSMAREGIVPLELNDVLGEFSMELERTLFARVGVSRCYYSSYMTDLACSWQRGTAIFPSYELAGLRDDDCHESASCMVSCYGNVDTRLSLHARGCWS
jgi:hypothetical protein